MVAVSVRNLGGGGQTCRKYVVRMRAELVVQYCSLTGVAAQHRVQDSSHSIPGAAYNVVTDSPTY